MDRFLAAWARWLTPRRALVYPLALWLGMVGFLAWEEVRALRASIPFAYTLGGDFGGFYLGGRFLVDGRMADLYDAVLQRQVYAQTVNPERVARIGRHIFYYPPFTVLLYAPFAAVDYLTGLGLWWLVGLLALLLSLAILRRALPPLGRVSLGRLFALSFLFFPTLAWFFYGQNSTWTLLVYVLCFALLRQGHDFWGGAALGLLLYKPQLALALALALLVRRRWRAVAGGALTVALWLTAGAALSPAAMRNYLQAAPGFLDIVRSGPIWGDHSFFAFAVLLLDSFSSRAADLLSAGLTLAGLALSLLWWSRTDWQPGSRAWDLTLAATLTLGLLVSPHLFLYDLLLLLLPLLIVWSRHPEGTGGRLLDGGGLLAATGLLYLTTFFSSYLALGQQHLAPLIGLPKVAVQFSVPVIVLWAWLIQRAGRLAPAAGPAPA